MNPLPLFLIIVSLPLLLGGCGEKEPVTDVKPEEPVAETKPKTEGVNEEELEERDGIAYLKGSNTPYTGKAYSLGWLGIRSEGMFKEGLREGVLTTWYGNGTKGSEVTFKNGIREGLALTWTVEGEWESKIIFGPEGLATWFYKSGQKESEGAFESDQISQRGVWTYWYENGQKKQEGSYRDDQREGLWTEWYENGQKEWETNYKDGKMDGLVMSWYENGQKMHEIKYEDGEEVEGSAKYWDKGEPLLIHSE